MSRFNQFIFLILFFVPFTKSNAQKQNPILERKLSITFNNESRDVVLNRISTSGGFQFSYNPSTVDVTGTYSGEFIESPVREILNKVFLNGIDYKEKGNYLILYKKKVSEAKQEKKPEFIFTGYVRDETGAGIPWASVYDKQSLESTVTNEYGFFKIRFFDKQLPLDLYFSKQFYKDTIVRLESASASFNSITLVKVNAEQPKGVDMDSIVKSAENTASSFFKGLENPANSKNINDTIYRKWQASVLPFIGTNGRLSGNVINEYSLNVLGGYSLGTVKAEVSGVINLNRGDVKYMQLAGFANINGGNIEGVQMAGFSNIAGKEVHAFQASGFANIAFGKFNGVQLAGFFNGVQDSVIGVQAAGFANLAIKSVSGTQLAGFGNITIDTVTGTQLGFVNYAKHVNGSQIGFFNIAQSTNGVPVGFLSYVHKGYHKLEVSTDEIFYINVAFRTGVKAFHNILTSGISPSSDSLQLWNFGYGIGTTTRLSKNVDLDFDLTSSQIVKGNDVDHINLLTKVYIGADFHLTKKMSLNAGFTVNSQLTKTNYNNYPDIFSYYEPKIFYNHTWELDKTNIKMWFGGKIGLRFL